MHIPASTRIPYVQQYINLSGFLRMPFATSSIQLSLQMFSNLPLRVFPDLFFQLFVWAFLGPHLYMQSFFPVLSQRPGKGKIHANMLERHLKGFLCPLGSVLLSGLWLCEMTG